jgi:hypothetical protein
MRTMGTDRWQALRAGDYVMTTWHGDTQLMYRAIRQELGWVLSRKVAGAGLLIIDQPTKTLREAQVRAQSDAQQPL